MTGLGDGNILAHLESRVTTALRSTLSAISHDHASARHFASLAAILIAIPLCVSVKGLDSDVSARAAIVPQVASPSPSGFAAGQALPLPIALPPYPSALDRPVSDRFGLAGSGLNGFARFAPLSALAAAQPFQFTGTTGARDQAIACLAAAAWYEAGNDANSQRSVIQVVLNRVKHPAFPKTVCGVVLQGSERRTGCQFSFTCDGSLVHRRPTAIAWQMARARAESALDGAVDSDVANATHYHADYVTPWWSSRLEALSRVGRHIFYRWPGAAGRPSRTMLPQGEDAMALPRLGVDEGGDFVGLARGTAALSSRKPQIKFEAAELTKVDPPAFISRPLPASAPAGTIVFALDAAQPSGRWAMAALQKCSGIACRVIGYSDAAVALRNQALPDRIKEIPQFLLVRDRVSGMTLAFWDCATAPRPDPNQCLPDRPDAIRSLIRDRQSP
ncbi:cell wall hydrolase [Novosphingobium aquiterrae]|uniref:Cell wall hydrolase n=1 Tax=Novosphingobium aquiterrae TaxID=624388 RepID=A0ABV6PFS9_9SPHN